MKTLFVLFLAALLHTQSIHSRVDFAPSIQQCMQEDLEQCEEVFIRAFSEAYKDFTPEQLGVEDKHDFLKAAFADVYDDAHLGLQTLMMVKREGKVIGFVGFKKTEKPHQIYISQLAVDPHYWRQGLGKALVLSVFDNFDDVDHLVVIPRKINTLARNFYHKLGFTKCSYIHPGYNPERYVGYEWIKSVPEARKL